MSKLVSNHVYIWKLDESKFHLKKIPRNIYCIIAHMITVYSFVSIEIALRQWDLQINYYRSFDFRCSVEPTAAILQKNLIEKCDACVCDKRSQRKHLSLFVCAAAQRRCHLIACIVALYTCTFTLYGAYSLHFSSWRHVHNVVYNLNWKAVR